MTAFSQSAFLQALGWAMLNSLWQLAAAWVLFQLLTGLGVVKKSSARSTLASALLLTAFACFIASFIQLLWTNGHSQPVIPLLYTASYGNAGLMAWVQQIMPIASLLYLAVLIFPLLNFIRNYRYVQTIRKYALKKADVQWRLFVQKLSAQMGIRRQVQLWMSDFVKSPVTIGYLRPVILLPMAAVNQLNTTQIEAVLLHELAHIRRFDYLLNLITRIIQTVLYFNPFVKAFVRIIEHEREKSCDELVLQFQYDAHGYASALLAMEKSATVARGQFAVAAAGSRKHELLSRVESLLGINRKPAFSFARLGGVLAALLCILGLHSLLILHKPDVVTADTNMLALMDAPYNYSDNTNTAVREMQVKPLINNASSMQSVAFVSPATPAPPPPAAAMAPAVAADKSIATADDFMEEATAVNPFAVQAGTRQNLLSANEEAQVKEALGASKRILEEVQWKTVEKSIADALTLAEKEHVKLLYQQEADKANWGKMEDQLRQAYAHINWNEVQTGLNQALAEIKLDSLSSVYNQALASLDKVSREMSETKQKAIPDTDVTLQKVEIKRQQVLGALKSINEVKRQRKIIRL
ncbi:MAG: M56 family metallopeptidase [Chitinophagaceae bacterium]|nr:M56 family metallopeptidase [Chitinophagaceae bacterium]